MDGKTASHLHLHHYVFLIDAQVNDYEEDNANYGHQSIGKITAHLQAKDIGLEDLAKSTNDKNTLVPRNFTKIAPMVMTPHCHAPSCIRQELWNSDTGNAQSGTVIDCQGLQGTSGTIRDSQGQSGTVRDSQGSLGTVRD